MYPERYIDVNEEIQINLETEKLMIEIAIDRQSLVNTQLERKRHEKDLQRES